MNFEVIFLYQINDIINFYEKAQITVKTYNI